MTSTIYGGEGEGGGGGTEKSWLTVEEGEGGRSEKVDVNHPKFFDRYSWSIEQ